MGNILKPKERNYSSIFLKNFADTDLEIDWRYVSRITRPKLEMETAKIERHNSIDYIEKMIWQPVDVSIHNSLWKFDEIVGKQIKKQLDAFETIDFVVEPSYKFDLEYDDFVLTNCWLRDVAAEELDHSGQNSYICLTIRYEYATMKSKIDYLAATKEITNKYKNENQ